jgi:hypothetical protein
MPFTALFALVVLAITLGGCSGGMGVGDACARHSDCDSTLQCVQRTCQSRCVRAPDCGDGFSCDENGFCVLASGSRGDACTSEVDCAPGLSCQIELDAARRLIKRCGDQNAAAPTGSACRADGDCRNGTCALGHCIDLCRITRDCGAGTSCMLIPHVETFSSTFSGCLVTNGVMSWSLPPTEKLRLPVPSGAQHASLVLSTAAPRSVAAIRVMAPTANQPVFQLCPQDGDFSCNADDRSAQFYINRLRHRREVGLSVLAIPSTTTGSLDPGIYTVDLRSFHTDGSKGPPPSVKAVLRLGDASLLDLHFHFLDLTEHPCGAAFGNATLDSAAAVVDASFQRDFLDTLRSIFKDSAALTLGEITYEDISRPDLDGLEISNVGALLTLGKHPRGVNVFFVRSLSPMGIQAYSPSPGPAGLGGTPRSGIVIGIDTLCYRSWQQLARLTAHEIARYMGLYQNVEVGGHTDGIADSDDSTDNLMFYSELGGISLSAGQRDILRKSPVLR